MTSRRALAIGLVAPVVLVCCALLQGCAATGSPDMDSRFGEATRHLNAQQLIDPNAPTRNAQRRLRTDGRTVREANDRYVESYASPPTSNVITLNVGSGTSAGK